MLKAIGNARFFPLAVFSLFILNLSACAGLWPNRIGSIALDEQAALIFEKKHCEGDYKYYYSGSDLHPSALLGIRKDLNLEENTLWKKIDMTPDRCRDMVSGIQTRALNLGFVSRGFVIKDDRGGTVGVWYSIMTATTPVIIKDDRTLAIHTPAVDTYLRYENDRK